MTRQHRSMTRKHPSWSGVVFIALLIVFASVLGARFAETAAQTAQQMCFGNLARLSQATLMYVAENDDHFPPNQTPMEPYDCQWGANNSNPWPRWPVVLDEYVLDRSLFLCPAVEVPRERRGAVPGPFWITNERISTKGWPDGPCAMVYPPGWGGSVTDSEVQGKCDDPERFRLAIGGAIEYLAGRRISDIDAPARHIMWADSSRSWLYLGTVIWADACRADCADGDGRADWENCPWSQTCGAGADFAPNPELRKRFVRHDGGSNFAFVDGHVEWLSVDEIIRAYKAGELAGIAPSADSGPDGQPWYLK